MLRFQHMAGSSMFVLYTGRDYVLARARDNGNLEHLRLYRLERTSPGGGS